MIELGERTIDTGTQLMLDVYDAISLLRQHPVFMPFDNLEEHPIGVDLTDRASQLAAGVIGKQNPFADLPILASQLEMTSFVDMLRSRIAKQAMREAFEEDRQATIDAQVGDRFVLVVFNDEQEPLVGTCQSIDLLDEVIRFKTNDGREIQVPLYNDDGQPAVYSVV